MKNVIDALTERGFIEQISSDELKKIVEKPIRFYIGFDPTADSLHLGNLVGIIALTWFQKFGHHPYALLGGATGRIGDPSGKSQERAFLSDEVLQHNVKAIGAFFDHLFSDSHDRPKIINNDQWYSRFTLVDFLRDVGKHFRLGTMLGKESVRARLDSEEGMSFTEFSYQILQAYDFYYLSQKEKVVLQLGGSDQWGNITAGIELSRRLNGESLYALTFPLLTRSDGKKFGKSEEGAIWLSSEKLSPYQFYQYLVRIPDADVIKLMKMLTFMSMEEIRDYENQMMAPGYIPNTAQKKLAEEVTRFVHKEEGLQLALRVTDVAKPGSSIELNATNLREIVNDMPSSSLSIDEFVDQKYTDVASKVGLVESKSEAGRLIKNGGAYLNNEKVEDPAFRLTREHLIDGKYAVFGAGKKKKILIKID